MQANPAAGNKDGKVVQDKEMSVSVLTVQTVSQTAQSHQRVMQLACSEATLTDHERYSGSDDQ